MKGNGIMPNVLVVGGTIRCSHGGVVKLLKGDSRLEIASAAALMSGMETGLSFAPGPGVVVPCPLPTKQPPGPPGSSPCTATISATTGVSTQLTVGDLGVLLDSASGQATNANDPAASWSVAQAGQTLVSVDQ
jgi:hypothetical protein